MTQKITVTVEENHAKALTLPSLGARNIFEPLTSGTICYLTQQETLEENVGCLFSKYVLRDVSLILDQGSCPILKITYEAMSFQLELFAIITYQTIRNE